MKAKNAQMTADLTLLIQTFNRPERIHAFVKALQNEDLSGIEVIIVDNGSTLELNNLEIEVHRLPHSKFIRKEKNCLCVDCGQSIIALATAPFILNPGDDDKIVSGSLQKLRAEIQKNPNVDVLVTRMQVVNQDGVATGHNLPPSELELNSPELLFIRLLRENMIAWPSTVFRPEMFKKLSDLNFTYRTSLDWAFWLLNSPMLKVETTDLRVIQYLRHESNESAVVKNDHQFHESISMRVRTLSNPTLRSFLESLNTDQVDSVMNEVVKDPSLVSDPVLNHTLLTLLLQSFSKVNQRRWEPFLMGLKMVPWEANSFEITHHLHGDAYKYWQGYPYNLQFSSTSCLNKYANVLFDCAGYVQMKKPRTITFSCPCDTRQVEDSILVNCVALPSMPDNQLALLLLQEASEAYHAVGGAPVRGIERKLISAYRSIKNILPARMQTLIRKFLNR